MITIDTWPLAEWAIIAGGFSLAIGQLSIAAGIWREYWRDRRHGR